MNKTCGRTLPLLFTNTLQTHRNRNAMVLIGGKVMTYQELDLQISALIRLLERLEIEPGDKVAIFSANMPAWSIAYWAITFMGAIVIPVLPDFHPAEVEKYSDPFGNESNFRFR